MDVKQMSLNSKSKAFTLPELMIVTAIIAVVAAFAVPGLSQFVDSNRLTASANDLYSSLSIARSEAIKRNTSVTLANSGSGWSGGWEVYETATPATKIYQQNEVGKSISVDSSSATGTVVFNSAGQSRTNHWGANGVTFCRTNKKGKKIDVAPSGSIRITEATCS